MQTGVGRRDGFAADLMLALLCGTATVVCFPIGGVEVVLLPGPFPEDAAVRARFADQGHASGTATVGCLGVGVF